MRSPWLTLGIVALGLAIAAATAARRGRWAAAIVLGWIAATLQAIAQIGAARRFERQVKRAEIREALERIAAEDERDAAGYEAAGRLAEVE